MEDQCVLQNIFEGIDNAIEKFSKQMIDLTSRVHKTKKEEIFKEMRNLLSYLESQKALFEQQKNHCGSDKENLFETYSELINDLKRAMK